MRSLTNKQQKSCKNVKICYICKEIFEYKHAKDKNIVKLGTTVIKQVNREVLGISNLKNNVPKEIGRVFPNGSNHDYHFNFIIKKLSEEFEGFTLIDLFEEFTCLGKNTEKYITFLVPIENDIQRIDKKGKEIAKLYLTDYSLLTVQDLWQAHYQILLIISLEEFIKLNVNPDRMIKNVKHVELNTKSVVVALNT